MFENYVGISHHLNTPMKEVRGQAEGKDNREAKVRSMQPRKSTNSPANQPTRAKRAGVIFSSSG